VIGQFAAFDHWRQRIVLVDNVVVPEPSEGADHQAAVATAYEQACVRLADLAADCARSRSGEMVPAPLEGEEPAEASRTMSSDEYRAAIEVAKEYITAGDIFQVVLSQRFDLQLDADPFDVYGPCGCSTRARISTFCGSPR